MRLRQLYNNPQQSKDKNMNLILQWIIENKIEVIAATLSLIYLYFSINQKILLWLFGILSSLLYIVVYFQTTFYAYMSLQVYYVLISIYGWIYWRKSDSTTTGLPVSKASFRLLLTCIAASLAVWLILYQILQLTDTDVASGDAFTTAIGAVATWMLARKILEHWLFWIVADSVSLMLYLHKEMYATAVLFLIYFIAAIVGYIKWKKGTSGNPKKTLT